MYQYSSLNLLLDIFAIIWARYV